MQPAPTSRTLSATGHVVLGLVSLRPGGGHELAAFAQRSVGSFFPIARSQVYLELERLCGLGLLVTHDVPQQRRASKRVYAVTESGESELRRWLEEGGVAPDRARSPFLVRIFFGDRLSSERLAALLDEYEEQARGRAATFAAIAERLADRPGSIFPRATALWGMRHMQATLEWVRDVRAIIRDAPPPARESPGDRS